MLKREPHGRHGTTLWVAFLVAAAAVGTTLVVRSPSTASELAIQPMVVTPTADTNEVDVTTVGDASVVLQTSWPSTSAQLRSGSVVAPNGWNVEYFDGNTWSSSEPATISAVQAVRASGTVRSEGDGGQGRTLRSESSVVELAGAPAQFGVSSGGDGYDVAFPDADRVINVFHHNGPGFVYPVIIECNLRTTVSACPEGRIVFDDDPNNPGPGPYLNANNSRITVHEGTKRAYTPVIRRADSKLGFLCIDYSIALPAPCATEFITVSSQSAITGMYDMGGAAFDADRFFIVNAVNHRLYCLDMATAAICPGFEERDIAGTMADGFQLPANGFEGPLGAAGWSHTSDISVFDGKVYFFQGNRPLNTMGCVDPVTVAYCGGHAPVSFGNHTPFDFPPFPVYDTTGSALLSVCTVIHRFCISATNSAAVAMPAALDAFLDPATAGGITGYGGYGQYLSLVEWGLRSNRLYLPVEAGGNNAGWLWPSDLACWDFSTEAPCDLGTNGNEPGIKYDVSPGLMLYAFVGDPYQECVWSNSDSGHIRTMGIDGGPCGGSSARTRFVFTPGSRLTCDPWSDQLSWRQLSVGLPASVTLSAVTLTVRTSAGTPVPGWTALALTSTTVDLSTLDIDDTGPDPWFDVDIDGGGLEAAAQVTAVLQSTAPPPQLCLDLEPVATCELAQTVAGRLPLPAFDVSHDNAVTANAATVTASAASTIVGGTFDAAALCGVGDVEGTATPVGGGTPLAGVTVTLRAGPNGPVVATTTTDGAGNYRFEGLTTGGYQVEFAPSVNGMAVTQATATLPVTVANGVAVRADAQYAGGAPPAQVVPGVDLPTPSTTATTRPSATATTTTSRPPQPTSPPNDPTDPASPEVPGTSQVPVPPDGSALSHQMQLPATS